MRSAARFRLLLDYGAHLGPFVRMVASAVMWCPVGYVIDLHDPFGLAWATALRHRFGRPDVAACLALARCSVPPGRAIVTGCVPAQEIAKLATMVSSEFERRLAPDAVLAESIEVELRLSRPAPPGTFLVLVVTDSGAEVAAERLDHPVARA